MRKQPILPALFSSELTHVTQALAPLRLRSFSKRLLLALCSLAIVLPPAHAQQSGPTPEQLARVDSLFSAELAKENYAGVTAGVVYKNQLVWSKSYGLADIGNNVPASADSVYTIGSITKSFTALMLLQLVERGRVHLGDPVSKYVPEISRIQNPFPNAAPPTLYQLATHTAGMPDNALGNSRPPQVPPGAQSQQVFVSWFPQLKFGYEPGTNTEYSNIGFAILGLALERAAGVPYVDYIKNEILIPLGMTHTGFTLTPDMAARLAKGYSLTPTGILAGPLDLSTSPDGPPYLLPAGGLFSTVGDMAKFTSFQLGYGPNSVLSKQSLQNNFLQVATASGDLSRGTGVGFSVNRSGGAVRVGHDGGLNTTNGGFEASAQMRLEADVGVIFLRNLTRRDRFGSDFKFAVLDAVSPRGLPLSADSKLINTSTRGQVGADGVGLIAGFVVDGGVPIQALVRAVGPTLTAFGVSGALADPTLTVYDNRGRVIADNDNWGSRGDSAAIANAASQVGAFGLRAGSSDSALLVTLPPGTYTVRATGAGGATGTALIEIYGVP